MSGESLRVVGVAARPMGSHLPESGHHHRQRHEYAQELQGDPKLASISPVQGMAPPAIAHDTGFFAGIEP